MKLDKFDIIITDNRAQDVKKIKGRAKTRRRSVASRGKSSRLNTVTADEKLNNFREASRGNFSKLMTEVGDNNLDNCSKAGRTES